jgi:hypothetical protein
MQHRLRLPEVALEKQRDPFVFCMEGLIHYRNIYLIFT